MMLARTLSAELLKLKRTLAFRMILVAPLLVATLQFFVLWNQKRYPDDFKLWAGLPRSALSLWAIFMLPLFITLETALLNGLEHAEKQWKHLFALPVPRYTIYVAKLMTVLAITALATLVLCGLIVLSGVALTHLRAELAAAGAIPYWWILKHAGLIWLASWLIVAIHNWVSMRWQGFALALGTGIAGTFFALFAASARLGKFYPWLLPINIFIDERFTVALLLGAVGGVLAAIVGGIEFTRRDVV